MSLFRIKAKLKAPAVFTSPVNLDGLVIYAMCRQDEVVPDKPMLRGNACPELPDCIPIDSCVRDGIRVFFSSDMQYEADGMLADGMVRSRDGVDLESLARKKLNVSGGVWKNMQKTLPLLACSEVWWDGYGDMDTCLHYLRKQVTSVGAMRGQGYGRIAKWSGRSLSGQRNDTWFHRERGVTLRTLPATWVNSSAETVPMPVTPPYWHKDSIKPCVPKGVMVKGVSGLW